MIYAIIGFVVGLFIGGITGFVVCGLVVANGKDEPL